MGYFTIIKEFNLKRLIGLIIETWFYSFSLMIIFLIFPLKFNNIGLERILMSFLPITYSNYWFITTYYLLYIFTPFINMFVSNISQKEYQKILILLTIFCSLIPTFAITDLAFSGLSYFLLYLLGGYFRLHKYTEKAIFNFVYGVFFYLLIFFSFLYLIF